MKKYINTLLLLLFTTVVFSQTISEKLIASTSESRGCTGSEFCSACKNCSGCKNCAKEGGTCGVCTPTPRNKPTRIKKKAKTSKRGIKQ
ncbi:hypothetical protein [Flavobacterium restrictum]|uniref:hypothetical protein n=1 Tax=Flavobacterium restrictum TaxID=2594428 RepID=UPI00163D479D|nr:hypothetical protein [Flavobacterium restrictum]